MDFLRWVLAPSPILLLLVLLVGLRWGATEAGTLGVAAAAIAAAAFETPLRTGRRGDKGVWDAVPILLVEPVQSFLEGWSIDPSVTGVSTGYGVISEATDEYEPLEPLAHPGRLPALCRADLLARLASSGHW